MLFKFTTPDMLNCALIDISTGKPAYDIVTVPLPQRDAAEECTSPKERRQTIISDFSGSILVSIIWNGRHPEITLLDEKIGGLTELFGSTTVRFMYVANIPLVPPSC